MAADPPAVQPPGRGSEGSSVIAAVWFGLRRGLTTAAAFLAAFEATTAIAIAIRY